MVKVFRKFGGAIMLYLVIFFFFFSICSRVHFINQDVSSLEEMVAVGD